MPRKIFKGFVVAHIPEHGVAIERSATGNQLASRCTHSEENGVIEFHITRREIGLVPPKPMKRVSPDGIRIVRKRLDNGAVPEADSSPLNLTSSQRKMTAKTPNPPQIKLSLPPTGTDEPNVKVRILVSVLQQEPANKRALTRLPRPAHRQKLRLLVQVSKLQLVLEQLKSADFCEEPQGVSFGGICLRQSGFTVDSQIVPKSMPLSCKLVSTKRSSPLYYPAGRSPPQDVFSTPVIELLSRCS